MTTEVIDIQNLSFTYNGHLVLKDVNLHIEESNFLAIIGPNGGGKTTLLKLMLGLLAADRGIVRVFGRPPKRVYHRIGYVPQDVHVNKGFPVSALDVVLMGRRKAGRGWSRHSRGDWIAAQEALDKMEMREYADRRMTALSGGQRQRVLIARALVSAPELLLLDEPTTGIDPAGQTEFYSLLKELNKTVTILMVSHDPMILSSYVKSVACVNQFVYFHDEPEITEDMLTMYQCPVELIAHGLPHRVLKEH